MSIFQVVAASLAVMSLHGAELAIDFPVQDVDGKVHQLQQNDAAQIRVFVFLSTECPIANAYSRTLTRLHQRLAKNPKVAFYGVVSDRTVTRKVVAKYQADFELSFPIIHETTGALASVLKPEITPEAFVLNGDSVIVYRGKIDDAYLAVGRRRPRVENHYLADAITAALAGKRPKTARTTAIGCVFETLPESDSTASITYTRDVAPIMNTRCVVCHRKYQVAPFPLTTYEHVAKRARQIVRVTTDRIMPPWMPVSQHADFVGDRRLTDNELRILKQWATTGRARGDAADLPKPPSFPEGWHLGQPDLIVEMQEPFTVPADGPDLFQYFVIPLKVPEDKLVSAIQFNPGNDRVVHHAVLFLDDKGAARKLDAATPEPGYGSFGGPNFAPSGALGGWSVGNTPRRLPNQMGRYLKKGSDLVIQVHYHPTGKVEVDQSEVGIYFVDRPMADSLADNGKVVGSIWMANYEMDIPAGEANYPRSTTYTLPRPVTMVGVVPHMHLLGKSMTVTATLPDGGEVNLVNIERWDYNWQDEYYYERPFSLPAGTVLQLDAVYDNSDDNPSNPNSPPQRVTWGDETNDEMLFCFFLLTSDKIGDLIHVIHDNLVHDAKQPRGQK